jgi:hypothetical protein
MSGLKRKFSDKTNLSDQENESPAEKKVKTVKVVRKQFGQDLSNKITATIITHLEQTKCQIFEESPSDSNKKEPNETCLDENNNVVVAKNPVFVEVCNERSFFEKIFKEVRSIFTTSSHDEIEQEMPGLFISFYDLIVNAYKTDTAELANHFKELAIQLLKPKFMHKLVNRFAKNFDTLKSCNAVVDLIRHRIQWLEAFISRGDPEETWHMPNARLPGFHVVEEFLRSDRKKQRYIIGTNIETARSFCNLYSGNKDDYSAYMVAGGVSTNAFVDMEKSRNYFISFLQRHRAIVAEYKEELDTLTGLLNDNSQASNLD